MPDAFEWSATCEMPVAFENPRLSGQAFFKTWTNLKKQVVSKKPGSQDDVTGTMTSLSFQTYVAATSARRRTDDALLRRLH